MDDNIGTLPDGGSAPRQPSGVAISEEMFAGIVSNSSDAIITVDESQRVVNFNLGAATIFGYAPEEIVGMPLDVLLPERFRAIHREHLKRFAASAVTARRMGERQEISGLRRNGIEFPADASILKTRVEGELLFTVVLRDITDRKQAERSQDLLVRAGDLLGASLDLRTTLRNIVRLAVPTLADWAMVHLEDAAGRVRCADLGHFDEGRDEMLRPLRDTALDRARPHPVMTVLDTGEPELIRDVSDAFLTAIAADDAQRELYRTLGIRSALVVPLAARGHIRGAIALFSSTPERTFDEKDVPLARELAQRAALALDNAFLYAEARDAVRARDDVLAVVSHDLGNPLSAIRIGTSLLLRSVPEGEQGTGGWTHIEGIRQSVAQMERLVNDLLEVKRIEAGQLTLDLQRHGIQTLLSEVRDMFHTIAAEKSIALEVEAPRGSAVLADRERVLQVFSNLVGNALKFTPAGGRVRVAAVERDGAIVFSVEDTGRGIAPDHLEHVFDRFWQAHRNNREAVGLGLGLAIVKGIVQAHGGAVRVESEQGRGTTFTFTLLTPATPAA
jgi:PAS domain S-box-containing protein